QQAVLKSGGDLDDFFAGQVGCVDRRRDQGVAACCVHARFAMSIGAHGKYSSIVGEQQAVSVAGGDLRYFLARQVGRVDRRGNRRVLADCVQAVLTVTVEAEGEDSAVVSQQQAV